SLSTVLAAGERSHGTFRGERVIPSGDVRREIGTLRRASGPGHTAWRMAAILPGTRLGRFEVHEYLGPGVLGPVHRAFEPALRTVAIQILTALPAEARPAFRELVPRLVALRHPNVASVLDSGEHEGTPYLVVEHAAGGPLPQRLWSVPTDEESRLGILAGAAEGLDH